MKKGKFIVIDGPEGAGKSTILSRLPQMLSGFPVTFTREPGGTPYAEKIRELILSDQGKDADPLTMFYLFSAARAEHVFNHVLPTLRQGTHVISDRFDSTTYAYQVLAEGRFNELDKLFASIRSRYEQEVSPYYIYLDVSPAIGRQRIIGRADKLNHFDERPFEWHERAREGFRTFLGRYCEPHKRHVIDAERPPGEVLADVIGIVCNILRQ